MLQTPPPMSLTIDRDPRFVVAVLVHVEAGAWKKNFKDYDFNFLIHSPARLFGVSAADAAGKRYTFHLEGDLAHEVWRLSRAPAR